MTSERPFKNTIGMTFVSIPRGSFVMGLRGFYEPLHEVTISPFWIGKFEVTNEQFERFKRKPRPYESKADNQPATRLTWDEATKFCRWLSRKENLRYRLPTEAEWEYAARGGLNKKLYPWGDNRNTIGRANFGTMKVMPVGSYAPNGYGLHDMAGSVEEFVSDYYDPDYYQRSPRADPKGPDKPEEKFKDFRLYRGGSFCIFQGYCGTRDLWYPRDRTWDPDDPDGSDGSGFRVVLEENHQSSIR